MEWAVIGAALGLGALVVRGVTAFGMAGKEVGKLRKSGQGVRRLREQAQARRWTWLPAALVPAVPVGRLATLPNLRQRGAAHGKFRQRQASAAVVSAVVDSGFESELEIDHGSTVLSLVITVEAPDLPGDLHLDPRRGLGYDLSGSLAPHVTAAMLNALNAVGRPAADIADGRASFVYPNLAAAAELDKLLAVADDVVSGLCNLLREEHP
ncbi:hypothetical protein GCM10010168_24980 [Actinoplanes ianthinogenes]|uniref:Uncharacterized protein n=1 Tax=Actinoplanes ianthinogenes TaxID=122358 RepID=A0ABN6CSA8_9ACTN|nr:hypothetical protein [Actinoplanes ianthinogenes]BCJ48138.1 hypothetical protein Aiant_87950 [Actinoplanes ianthinogenes]GGR06697.1 hypothetical protein GCM10010168_24980 [Actinoplanes ianthinogenes]